MGLFKKKDKGEKNSPAPNANPYAQNNSSTPDTYTNAPSSGYGGMSNSAPPPYAHNNSSNGGNFRGRDNLDSGPTPQSRNEKSPVPPGGYGGNAQYGGNSGYGGGRYAGGGSYGDRGGYGTANPYQPDGQAPKSARPGGYGGLGGADVQEDDNRKALFGNQKQANRDGTAPNRYASSQDQQGAYVGRATNATDRNDLFGDAAERIKQRQARPGYEPHGSYGESDNRELTEEERERQEVKSIRGEAKQIRGDTAASTARIRGLFDQVDEQSAGTQLRVHEQGESLIRTDRAMHGADFQIKQSKGLVQNLEKYQSMFAISTGKKELAKQDEAYMNEYEQKQLREQAMRGAEYEQKQAKSQLANSHNPNNGPKPRKPVDSKYLVVDDSDSDVELQEHLERNIDDDLDYVSQGMGRLKMRAANIGQELSRQNEHISKIDGDAHNLNTNIERERRKLERIGK